MITRMTEIDSVNVKVKRIIAKLEKTLKDVNDTSRQYNLLH